MTTVTLIEASPWAPDGSSATVRLAGGGRRGYDHLGHVDWKAGVVDVPRFKAAIGFDENGWTNATMAQSAALRFAPHAGHTLDLLSGYFWKGCALTMKTGDDASASPSWTTEFSGTASRLTVEDGAITITISDNSTKLDVPVTTARFAATGGIEGGSDVEGRLKRRSWGRCWNVEARVLDKANNIYEVGDPAYPLQAIDTVKDVGRAGSITTVAWAGSIAATLAALIASSPAAGGGCVAPSIACIKWWTQPTMMTADIKGEIGAGYVETVAAIAARVMGLGSVTISNTAAMITARPGPAGLHVGAESETIATVCDRMLLGASLLWFVEPAGTVALREISLSGSPVASLRSDTVARAEIYSPTKTRRVGYQRNERVHSAGEISAALYLVDGTAIDDAVAAAAETADWTGVSSKPVEVTDGRITAALGATGVVNADKVKTLSIEDASVTIRAGVEQVGTQVGTGSSVNILTFSLVLPYDAMVVIQVSGSQNYTSGVPAFDTQLLVNSSQVAQQSAGTGDFQSAITMATIQSLSAGTHTIDMEWRGDTSGIYLGDAVLIIDAAMK